MMNGYEIVIRFGKWFLAKEENMKKVGRFVYFIGHENKNGSYCRNLNIIKIGE